MNNFNLNRGNLDKCQINSQSKYQTRTSWGYFGVSGTMMKTINLYSWLRRLCHLILLSQDSTWVETVCSWRQANQDTICCSSKLAFQKRCFVGFKMCQFSSVAQSCPTLCDPWTAVCQASLSIINSRSLLNSCPLSWWCHPTVSSSVIPFSSYLQSFSSSGSFPRSQLFPTGGQSIGVSASTSVLPVNIQDWFAYGWTGWISLQSKGLLQHHSSKASILRYSAFFTVQLSRPYMTTGKAKALTKQTSVDKVMSLLFNMLSRLVITFLPRSNVF